MHKKEWQELVNIHNTNVDKIKELAKQQGLTMKYLCEIVGKPAYFLSALRLGQVCISANELAVIADKLNTTVEYLTDRTDMKEKPGDVGIDEAGLKAIYSEEEKALIELLNSVPEEHRDKLYTSILALLKQFQ